MKQFAHKILAIFMTCVVLFTTLSFTVDMHYCGETLVDFSFTKKAKSCGMEKAMALMADCKLPKITKKSCCTDHEVIKQGQEDLRLSLDKIAFNHPFFIAPFTYSYIIVSDSTTLLEVPLIPYSPPIPKRDVQVLHQSFLI
ncbi:hypothetical protein [uncultured Nonlabens sp.]|uniref:HYC_CC_PP family protein n=1 Tax=uncultured Nonlabens sp. TaxID=859306 RepID=UPI0026130512|nr:hypothetical protein [uncultured Nonlabens sp.]